MLISRYCFSRERCTRFLVWFVINIFLFLPLNKTLYNKRLYIRWNGFVYNQYPFWNATFPLLLCSNYVHVPTYLSSSHPVAHKADTRPLHWFLSAAIFSTSFQVVPIFFRSPSIVLLQVSLALPRFLFPSAGVHLSAVFVMDWFPFLKTWPSHLNWSLLYYSY